ncbi:hypothetical protein [Nocardioides convexus]|nr:hypothetical protein [Nocardioides convexus]
MPTPPAATAGSRAASRSLSPAERDVLRQAAPILQRIAAAD